VAGYYGSTCQYRGTPSLQAARDDVASQHVSTVTVIVCGGAVLVVLAAALVCLLCCAHRWQVAASREVEGGSHVTLEAYHRIQVQRYVALTGVQPMTAAQKAAEGWKKRRLEPYRWTPGDTDAPNDVPVVIPPTIISIHDRQHRPLPTLREDGQVATFSSDDEELTGIKLADGE
jgi:hypothetical protein